MDILTIVIDEHGRGLDPDAFVASFSVAKAKRDKIRSLGCVRVNGEAAVSGRKLVPGDVVSIDLKPFEGLDFVPEYGALDVLYEDESVLVANKPAGIIVHPADKRATGTFVNLLAGHFAASGLDRRVGYLHRLDRDTTGTLLVAKHFLAHAKLAALWDHEHVTRTYLCIASGRFREPEARIDLPLGRDRHVAGRFRVNPDGERAVTRYRVLRQYEDFALLSLVLETGRTHQIRVHMSHLGHPLLGDVLYGGPAGRIARVALHAETIAFPHPMTGETISVSAPVPQDFARILA